MVWEIYNDPNNFIINLNISINTSFMCRWISSFVQTWLVTLSYLSLLSMIFRIFIYLFWWGSSSHITEVKQSWPHRKYQPRCASNVMDNISELENGEPCFNSSHVRYIHLYANTLEKGKYPHFLPRGRG